MQAVAIENTLNYEIEFSFCSLVTRPDQYQAMLSSLENVGFDESCAEFLYIDNTAENVGDGFSGLNRLASSARGRFVVFCHQDVLAVDGPDELRRALAELDQIDPRWALASNAGFSGSRGYYYLNEPGQVFVGKEREKPMQVTSIDENLIVMRQDARLGFSSDLQGFHLYGTDLVTQANIRGQSAYVIDFRVEHTSSGTIDQRFWDACIQFETKYARALQPRHVQTTCASLDIGKVEGKVSRRKQRERERGPDFVRPSKKVKKVIRSWASGNTIKLDGLRFRHPRDISYAEYHALRRDLYRRADRNLISNYLPEDLTVVILGDAYGIVSGLISRKIDNSSSLIVVDADPLHVHLRETNVRLGSAERDPKVLGGVINYSGIDGPSPKIETGAHEIQTASTAQKKSSDISPAIPAMTLSHLLKIESCAEPYALVCDIAGAEFDLVANDRAGLTNCQMMIVNLHPDLFYERGESVGSFLKLLDAAGFEARVSEDCAVAAFRKE